RGQWPYVFYVWLFYALLHVGVTLRTCYGLFGHSACGQFVHRMLSLGFCKQVVTAVTANAGTYAMPDLDIEFPYGLGGVGLNQSALRAVLRFPLIVMAGTADIDATSEHFPKEEQAMKQGGTRYERAHRYIANARVAASRLGVECAWKIIDVPDVGHEGDRMSVAAAPVLRVELGLPVAQQRVGILQTRSLAREQEKELVIEVIVVGQGEDRAAAGEIAHPIVRRVVGETVAEILVAVLEQEIDRVRA